MRPWLLILVLSLALAAGGCGSSDNGTTQQAAPATQPTDSTFPTNGTVSGPNVTTTGGPEAKKEPGQAGGGSSATCIGC